MENHDADTYGDLKRKLAEHEKMLAYYARRLGDLETAIRYPSMREYEDVNARLTRIEKKLGIDPSVPDS